MEEREVARRIDVTADPKRLIEHQAKSFVDRPDAVLRELVQNAMDALAGCRGEGFAEICILSTEENPPHGQYHLVVRDSGPGMTEGELAKNIGVLGYGTKVNAGPDVIGQFGVGFYSTHAVCSEVAILSKTSRTAAIGWRYLPEDAVLEELEARTLDELLAHDFENHPRDVRRRATGTSVYLRLDLHRSASCSDWLRPSSLARDLRRDCIMLPSTLFVGDHSCIPAGGPVPDFHGRDIKDVSVSLPRVPWQATDGDVDSARAGLIQYAIPWVREASEFSGVSHVFNRTLEDARVAGMLYMLPQASEGFVEVFLKRMRVESTRDMLPAWATTMYGIINIDPGNRLNLEVPPARDRIIRGPSYTVICDDLTRVAAEFLVAQATALSGLIQRAVHEHPDPETVLGAVESVIAKSPFIANTRYTIAGIEHFFRDVGEIFAEVRSKDDCPPAVKGAITNFAQRIQPVEQDAVSAMLRRYQRHADSEREREIRERATRRASLQWDPPGTRLFLKEVGPHLPVLLCRRQNLRAGNFVVSRCEVPLDSLVHIDPECSSAIKVLVEGSADDYFAANRLERSVVVPRAPSDLMLLAAINYLCSEKYPFRFVEAKRKLFQDIATSAMWEPLLDILREIANSAADRSSTTPVQVEVRAYVGQDRVPIVVHSDGLVSALIVNGYNPLMQDLNAEVAEARAQNDQEVLSLLAQMCHELYHHRVPAGSNHDAHAHDLETRARLLLSVLSMVKKYRNLRVSA
jgi:hypothetical protein